MNRAESELVHALVGYFRLGKLNVESLGRRASQAEQPAAVESPQLSTRLAKFIEKRATEIEQAELGRISKAH